MISMAHSHTFITLLMVLALAGCAGPTLIQDRFLENKDETITDTQTRLMWGRCLVGQRWESGTCVGRPKFFVWVEAREFAEESNLAQHNDWRLPTVEELDTLVYCSTGMRAGPGKRGYDWRCKGDYQKPTINLEAFPGTMGTGIWTQSMPRGMFVTAWQVDFGTGQVDGYASITGYAPLRLMRKLDCSEKDCED